MSKGKHPKLSDKASLGKHRKIGVAHNHANSISRTREYNRQLEEEKAIKEKRKGKLFDSVKDLFK